MKHITLIEMLEECLHCIMNGFEIPKYYWKNGEGQYQLITQIDLLDRIKTLDDDFTEYEWEIKESRLYREGDF